MSDRTGENVVLTICPRCKAEIWHPRTMLIYECDICGFKVEDHPMNMTQKEIDLMIEKNRKPLTGRDIAILVTDLLEEKFTDGMIESHYTSNQFDNCFRTEIWIDGAFYELEVRRIQARDK